MNDILIHACDGRMWWVENHLIPALRRSGVPHDKIHVWNAGGLGNLTSFIRAASEVALNPGAGMWHLQDDVYPCRNFAERAEELEAMAPIVQGFYPENQTQFLLQKGTTPFKRLPPDFGVHENREGYLWSFQCIHIPNSLYLDACSWIANEAIPNNLFPNLIKADKGDDSFFFEYLFRYQPHGLHYRCENCLVEHVDTFMGGSVLGHRIDQAGNFPDEDIIKANFRRWMQEAEEASQKSRTRR